MNKKLIFISILLILIILFCLSCKQTSKNKNKKGPVNPLAMEQANLQRNSYFQNEEFIDYQPTIKRIYKEKYEGKVSFQYNPMINNDTAYLSSKKLIAFDLKKHKVKRINENMFRAVVTKNTIFIESFPDATVKAYDLIKNKTIWSYKSQSYIATSLLVDGKYLYFEDGVGTLYCLSTKTGKLLWIIERDDTLGSSPAIKDNILISTYKGSMYALNKKDGTLIWDKYEPSILEPIIFNDSVFIVADHDVKAISVKDGKEKWTYKSNIMDESVLGLYPATNGEIFVYSNGYTVRALNAKTGLLKWKFKDDPIYAFAFVKNGLYTLAGDAVYGISLEGEKLWKIKIQGNPGLILFPYNGKLYFCADSSLYEIS